MSMMRNWAGARDGFSLAEVLVSLVVLALAATVALALYDSARQSFKVGENVTEQQQVIRIAFDKLGSDLRMAGFNYNPDGDVNRTDEQIEGAFLHAIVVRADFDGSDAGAANDPERALADGSPFLSVSTGNDEIVTYALASPESSDNLSFEADVNGVPRDGNPEPVQIDGLALVGTGGPYTLYRITLDDAGSPVRTPLIDNVRSLQFTYYDRFGNELDPMGGAEDPDTRLARASIRRIGVEIEGLTRDPDLQWVDARDPNPLTQRFRKFMLAGDIKPRNLGLVGMKDVLADSLPPGPPSAPALHPGHCNGLYVEWEPNPAGDEVAYYRLRYGTAPGALTGQASSVLPHAYLADLQDSTLYFVVLEAVDDDGNVSALSASSSATTRNDNTPAQPQSLSVTRQALGQVLLSWTSVSENTEPVPGADPAAPQVRDLAGYRVYRSSEPDFTPSAITRIALEDAAPAAAQPSYLDAQPVNCEDSYYRLTAVDACGIEGEPTAAAFVAQLGGSVDPKVPYNEDAYLHADGFVRLKWRAVREDVAQNPIFVEDYLIFRKIGPDPPATVDFLIEVTGTEYIDNPSVPAGQFAWYMLKARDECSRESDYSSLTQATCWFPGDLVFFAPAYGATFSGDLTLQLGIVGGSAEGSYDNLHLTGLRISNGNQDSITPYVAPQSPGSWSYTWPDYASGTPDAFEITALVDYIDVNLATCRYSTSILVTKEQP